MHIDFFKSRVYPWYFQIWGNLDGIDVIAETRKNNVESFIKFKLPTAKISQK